MEILKNNVMKEILKNVDIRKIREGKWQGRNLNHNGLGCSCHVIFLFFYYRPVDNFSKFKFVLIKNVVFIVTVSAYFSLFGGFYGIF